MRFDTPPWQRLVTRGTSVMIPNIAVDKIDKQSYETHDSGVRRRATWVVGNWRGNTVQYHREDDISSLALGCF